MIALSCKHESYKVHGKSKSGETRYKCKTCGRTFTKPTQILDGMRIGVDRACRIIEMLCEGLSVSTAARLTGTDPHTIIDLMVMVGGRCQPYMWEKHRNLTVDSIQADETWSYIGLKQKTANRIGRDTSRAGDCYCFTAIDRESKLMVTWHFGKRDQVNTDYFCRKLAVAIDGRFKLSTDGFHAYEPAVNWHLFQRTDYGQVIKVFGMVADDPHHFGSPSIISQRKKRICRTVQHDEICTSHCERLNGTIRNYVKRTARLTYTFSKKWENHQAMLAMFFMAYNYCKSHRSLKKQTPAMAHGIADHKWTVRELILATAGN